MVTKLTVVIISQYIHVSNHCVVHLKLIQCYVTYISIFKKYYYLNKFKWDLSPVPCYPERSISWVSEGYAQV